MENHMRDRRMREGGGGPGFGGPRMGGTGMGGPDMGGPGMEGGMGMGGGQMDPRMLQFERLRGYLDAVDRYTRLARDPSVAGIAAVVQTADLLRGRGADAGIDYFNKLLPEVKDPAIQRAIRVQLIELYKQANKPDQALEQLKTLMTGAAPAAPAASSAADAPTSH
jgi:hypothetical protein